MYLMFETCIPSLRVNGYLVMGVVVCSIWFWVQVNGILGWSGCILFIVLRIVLFFLVGCIWSVHGIWQHVSGISGVYLNFIKYVFDI